MPPATAKPSNSPRTNRRCSSASAGRLLTSRQLTGQFPNYEAVLPKDNTRSVSRRHRRDLAAAIQRVAQFADERSGAIRLRLEKNELKISSSSTETGESEDSIEIDYTAEPLTIGFNSQYLIDFLKTPSAGRRAPRVQGRAIRRPAPPGRDAEDFKYRYIVMPMRI